MLYSCTHLATVGVERLKTELHCNKQHCVSVRPDEPVQSSPSAIVSCTAAAGDVASPKSSTGGTLLWPIATHAAMQPNSQKALAKAIGLATSQSPASAGKEARSQTAKTTQAPGVTLGGLRPGRYVVVNGGSSARRPLLMPRCFVMWPTSTGILTSATIRPPTQTVTAVNRTTVLAKQRPAIRNVIPRATFRVPTSISGCRVTPLRQRSTSSTGSPQGLAVVRSVGSVQSEETGKVSPLSCIQTLVANAGAAPTQWIALRDQISEHGSSSTATSRSDGNDMVIRLSVGPDVEDPADPNINERRSSCYITKRLSTVDSDELESKTAKQS